jgi:hypothetical protein
MKNFILSVALLFTLSTAFSQNVGIGIATPLYKLHVHGDIFMNSSQGNLIVGYPGADNKWRFATTNGGQDLLLISENAAAVQNTRMYMTQTGLIGIGTSTPGSTLEVKSPTSQTARFNGASSMYVSILENDIYRGYFGSYSGAAEDVDFGTGSGSTGKLHLTISATPKLTINNTGDVGIGTTAPDARLGIITGGSGSGTNGFMMRNSIGDTMVRIRDNGSVAIGYNGTNSARPLNLEGSGMNFWYNVSTLGGAIFPDANNNIVMWSNSSGPGMNVVLQPSWGQVTIGTYTPATGYKLSVNGKAIFTEARVQLNASWPDYVFQPDYKLRSLEDLEKSLLINKHLPNIPPAAEAEKNGIDLGDMNRRLLEKVEELTLYIIDLNKKIGQQEKRIQVLEKK